MPIVIACSFSGAGCGAGGHLTIRSESDPETVFKGGFESGIYRVDSEGELTILLYDGPAEQPTEAMTIRMLWRPRAARTPLDPDATNATIRYVIFTGNRPGQVSIYSGAGYLYPKGRLGGSRLGVSLWQANLRWMEASEGFEDRIGRARLTGDFTVTRNDRTMYQALRRLSVLISEALGYPQQVRADSPGFR